VSRPAIPRSVPARAEAAPDAPVTATAEMIRLTMAHIRRRVEAALRDGLPAAANDADAVPRETVAAVSAPAQTHRPGTGLDWSDAEIAALIALRNSGMKVPAILARLPGRSEKAIRTKLARLGLAIQARRGGKRLRRRSAEAGAGRGRKAAAHG
jgi:hypothetical protein